MLSKEALSGGLLLLLMLLVARADWMLCEFLRFVVMRCDATSLLVGLLGKRVGTNGWSEGYAIDATPCLMVLGILGSFLVV